MSGTNKFPEGAGFLGTAGNFTGGNLYNALEFIVRKVMSGKAFAGPVKVVAVHGGGPSGGATIDIQPLVDQVDGFGNRTPHGTIYGVPVFRYQSGGVAFISDPMVGDIGHAVISDRDISQVKRTQGQAAPGSERQNSWSDAVYYGSIQDKPVTTYIHQSPTGISITTPQNLTINAQNCQLDAAGNLKLKGEITAKDGGAFNRLTTHTHPSNGAPPTPNT